MAGLTNDVCIVFPAISAAEDGYEVQVVVDAGGSPTQIADTISTQRMKDHGVTLTTTNQLLAELAYNWAEGKGHTIQTILVSGESGKTGRRQITFNAITLRAVNDPLHDGRSVHGPERMEN